MTAPTSSTGPGGEAGRVRCLYCGANNFPASAACWQCGRPLKAAPTESSEAGMAPLSTPLPGMAPAQRLLTANPITESALAPKAAATLGLMFPYIGLPVGIVFLMLDDPRKTQLGWMAIGWSVLGTVLNSIAFSILFGLLAPLLKGLAPHAGGGPSGLPSIPDIGGDGAGLLLPGICLIRSLASGFFPHLV